LAIASSLCWICTPRQRRSLASSRHEDDALYFVDVIECIAIFPTRLKDLSAWQSVTLTQELRAALTELADDKGAWARAVEALRPPPLAPLAVFS
jgi:hypothetical protein